MTILDELAGLTNPYLNDAVATEPLDAVNPVDLLGIPVPPRQWLVADWIPMSRVTAIYGAGGEGKTLLGQMLATACAIEARFSGCPSDNAIRCCSIAKTTSTRCIAGRKTSTAITVARSPTSAR
jgi:hypothetical protein